jgi:hypothetical protein
MRIFIGVRSCVHFTKPHAPLQPSIPVGGADDGLVPVPAVAAEVMQQERPE